MSLTDILAEKQNYLQIGKCSRFKSLNNRYFSKICDEFNNINNPRFYYWEYYKNKTKEDHRYNPGYNYSDWFIESRFSDLKDELINNNICSISIYQFNDLLEKAIILKIQII